MLAVTDLGPLQVSSHLLSLLWDEDKIVFGWTANTPTMIAHVVDNAGVDAIVTNFPDVVQQIVDTRSSKCQESLMLQHR